MALSCYYSLLSDCPIVKFIPMLLDVGTVLLDVGMGLTGVDVEHSRGSV